MHENRFNEYRIPSGMLIVFLEKALTLISMETHLDDVSHNYISTFFSLNSTQFLKRAHSNTNVIINYRMKRSKNASNLTHC